MGLYTTQAKLLHNKLRINFSLSPLLKETEKIMVELDKNQMIFEEMMRKQDHEFLDGGTYDEEDSRDCHCLIQISIPYTNHHNQEGITRRV